VRLVVICPECGAGLTDDEGASWPYCPVCGLESEDDVTPPLPERNPVVERRESVPEHVRQWWRRRRRRPYDWAERCPELVEPGGHVRLVARARP
jgi:uncharacterized Zn finger protein (UPF0148 family)